MGINRFLDTTAKEDKPSETNLNILRAILLKAFGDDYYFKLINLTAAINEVKKIEKELDKIEVDNNVYCGLIYIILHPEILEMQEKINHAGIYKNLIEKTFFNEKFRNYVKNMPLSNNGFLSFMQSIIPDFEILLGNIKRGNYYELLKSYKKIIDICNNQGIEPNSSVEYLKNELSKRHLYDTDITALYSLKKSQTNKKFHDEENFSLDNFVYMKNYFYPAIEFQKYLFNMLLPYFKEQKISFRQYSDEINLYLYDDILLVAYKYDDTPNMILIEKLQNKECHTYDSKDISYNWKEREFWAKMFKFNILSKEKYNSKYRIQAANLMNFYQIPINAKVVFAPEEYMDEALAKKIMNSTELISLDSYTKLRKMGIDLENISDKLLTLDGSFFFKDPRLVDELNISNIDKYPSLKQITEKSGVSRRKSITGIISYADKNFNNKKL